MSAQRRDQPALDTLDQVIQLPGVQRYIKTHSDTVRYHTMMRYQKIMQRFHQMSAAVDINTGLYDDVREWIVAHPIEDPCEYEAYYFKFYKEYDQYVLHCVFDTIMFSLGYGLFIINRELCWYKLQNCTVDDVRFH